MKFENNRKIILYIVAFVVVAALINKFYISDVRNRFSIIQKEIRLAEALLKRNLEIQNSKEEIFSDYKKYEKYLKSDLVNENDAMGKLFHVIENAARISGSSLVNLSPQRSTKENSYQGQYKARVRLESQFDQLINFLYNIQTSNLLIKVDTLSITSQDEKTGILRVDGIITLIIPI